jgi:type II secretory pathway pseudopilin PulG
MQFSAPFSASRHFTLIELLVVIVVVMILAAMLMSAMQGAKASARRLQCMSNLRQLAIGAGGIYVNDNNRVVVPALGAGPTTRLNTPAIRDQGAYGIHSPHGYSIMWTELIDDLTIDLATVPEETGLLAYCPGDETYGGMHPNGSGALAYSNAKGWWCGIYRRQTSYALNHYFSNAKGNGPHTSPARELNYVKITRAEVPRETVLLAETHYTAVQGARWEFATSSPDCLYDRGPFPMINEPQIQWPDTGAISYPRHDGQGFHVAFTDLHGEWINHDGSPNSPWMNPTSAADIAEMEKHWVVDYE